ncbi:MAG: DUF4845 domain-containing protein [Kangiellaceae bacterium]|nr:DUF4845 domain-containing protein [Kangiellaceae bacterium]
MLNRNYQNGMTAAGWLIIMAIVLFFIYLAIKLVPAYMEFGSIKSSMASVAEQKVTEKREVIRLLEGRFNVNSVTSIKAKDAKIKEATGGKALEVKYEKKIELFGNVSALLDFQHEVLLQ